MGLKPFIRGIAILSVLAVTLLLITLIRDYSLSSARATESTFLPLLEKESLNAKDISTVEVMLPNSDIRWHYKRIDGLWRLPEFAGAFALNGEVDNLVNSLLQGRMRPVGWVPEDEARYGLLPQSVLTLTLFRDSKEIVKVRVGALRPGAAKDERYVLRDKDETVYLFNSNPAVFFPEAESPAMLDRHILPRAIPHGSPERLTFSGSKGSEVRELVIKELPVDPKKLEMEASRKAAKKEAEKKEPTHEFIGTMRSGATAQFDDDTMTYVSSVADIEFDKIVGSISPVQVEYQKFDNPLFEVTIHFKDGKQVSLVVSSSLIEGKYPILNKETGQMFIIASEKVDALVPNLKPKVAK